MDYSDHEQRHEARRKRRQSGGMMPFLIVLLGLALIVLPFVLPVLADSQGVLLTFGTTILIVGAVIITITRLYVKAAPNEAYVRTGMGGPKTIVDGGALVIPVVHELQFVSLETMRLDVDRSGQNALITGDNLRADLKAEFYIHVTKTPDGVAAAAKSLGDRSMSPDSITKLVFEKLVSALRTVAAKKTLQDLHAERADFAREVQEIVATDLESNGLTLESVTISGLDQTSIDSLNAAGNVFDARGNLTITEVIQANRVATNNLEREADKKVAEQDVEKQKFVFAQEQAEAEALAEKNASVEKAQSRARQEAATYESEQLRTSEIARVEQEEAVAVREQKKQQAEEVAQREKEQKVQVAEVKRDEAAEVARREKLVAIAKQEQIQAAAEAERALAEKEREEALQATLTVEETEKARRAAEVKYITAVRTAEEERQKEIEKAEAEAFSVERAATAKQTAAEAEAEATRTRAQADRDAASLKAEGDRAIQMVPVEVDTKAVEVEDARVTVKRRDLEAQAEFEGIARELTIELARINAEKEAKIETARAYGNALAAANMTVWGSPETLSSMTRAFTSGQENGMFLQGLGESMPAGVSTFAEDAVRSIGHLAAGLVKKFTGMNVSDGQAQDLLRKYLTNLGPEKTQEILRDVLSAQRSSSSRASDSDVDSSSAEEDDA